MKLEMGESLVRTWMRHHKGCQLAELNWKPSMNWGNTGTPEHQKWYDSDQINFKKTESSKLSQLLKQAEIDVLGVRFEEGKAQKIIAADIAVHTGGLSYKDKENTKKVILTKLLRMAIILDLHFPNIPATLLFISPKITPATLTCILGEDYDKFLAFLKPDVETINLTSYTMKNSIRKFCKTFCHCERT